MRVWFDQVTRNDARLLVQWWNAHTIHRHVVRKQPEGRYYQVVRQ